MIVYSWNMLFSNKRLDEAFAFVRDSGADVFCLQEVPEAFLPYLARLPYHQVVIEEAKYIFRRHYGSMYVVILSRYPVVNHTPITLPLPRTRFFARFMHTIGRWGLVLGDRNSCLAGIALPQGTLHVYNLHLFLTYPKHRREAFERALKNRDLQVPTIACGDLNILDRPRVAILNWLLGGSVADTIFWRRERPVIERSFASFGLTNALRGRMTHEISRSQLDHILVSSNFDIREARVITKRYGSDHHPVCVEVEFKKV